MNKTVIIVVAAVLVVAGVATGWFFVDQNAKQKAAEYVTYRKDNLAELQDLDVSKKVSSKSLTRPQAEELVTICKDLDTKIEKIRTEVVQPGKSEVAEVESKYSLDEMRKDVEHYRDTCWYYATYEDNSSKASAALDSKEHEKYLIDRKQCQGDRCFKIEMRHDYNVWRTENILRPYRANKAYYDDRQCPIEVDGGEQFCTAVANYASATANYEEFYLRKVQANNVEINDPEIMREYKYLRSSFDNLQRISQAIGDFKNPYDVYRHELDKLEKKFDSVEL